LGIKAPEKVLAMELRQLEIVGFVTANSMFKIQMDKFWTFVTLKTLGNGKKINRGSNRHESKFRNPPILRNFTSDLNNIFPEPHDCACRVRV